MDDNDELNALKDLPRHHCDMVSVVLTGLSICVSDRIPCGMKASACFRSEKPRLGLSMIHIRLFEILPSLLFTGYNEGVCCIRRSVTSAAPGYHDCDHDAAFREHDIKPDPWKPDPWKAYSSCALPFILAWPANAATNLSNLLNKSKSLRSYYWPLAPRLLTSD